MELPIYLDNHATTQVDPRVLEAMLPCFTEHYGNQSSTSHPYGWKANELVESARLQIASLAGCEPQEIIFTSGATESVNLVLKGIIRNREWSEIHVVTCVTEHTAVLDTCSYIEGLGARVTRIGVDNEGNIDLDKLSALIAEKPTLLTLMHANNEIGIIHPIEQIAHMCRGKNVLFHVDAAQSFGKIAISFDSGEIDLMSVSGHKLYAPKGIGALILRRKVPPVRLNPLMHGGGHERGFRSGTLNVPGIVGLGKACELCTTGMIEEAKRIQELRSLLLEELTAQIPGVRVNGSLSNRLPGNLNISIPDIEGQHLLPALRDHFSVSSGSACTSAQPRASHVLAALGVSDELAHSSLRFGIGRFNTAEEIKYVATILPQFVQQLSLSR